MLHEIVTLHTSQIWLWVHYYIFEKKCFQVLLWMCSWLRMYSVIWEPSNQCFRARDNRQYYVKFTPKYGIQYHSKAFRNQALTAFQNTSHHRKPICMINYHVCQLVERKRITFTWIQSIPYKKGRFVKSDKYVKAPEKFYFKMIQSYLSIFSKWTSINFVLEDDSKDTGKMPFNP